MEKAILYHSNGLAQLNTKRIRCHFKTAGKVRARNGDHSILRLYIKYAIAEKAGIFGRPISPIRQSVQRPWTLWSTGCCARYILQPHFSPRRPQQARSGTGAAHATGAAGFWWQCTAIRRLENTHNFGWEQYQGQHQAYYCDHAGTGTAQHTFRCEERI